jgi:hypothetical protein
MKIGIREIDQPQKTQKDADKNQSIMNVGECVAILQYPDVRQDGS